MSTSHRSLTTLVVGIFLISTNAIPFIAFASTYGSSTYDSGTYSGVLPSVTTTGSSAVDQTDATLAATLVGLGANTPTTRGFVWGTSTSYGATTTESGSFSTGSFSASLTGLTCNTTYHFEGYAQSTSGIGYGGDANFTTSACSMPPPAPTVTSGGGNGPAVGSFTIFPPSQLVPGFAAIANPTVPTTPISTPPSPTVSIAASGLSRNLQIGASGNDVQQLQVFLNTHGFPIALSGAGSSGKETTYFGAATKAALAKFQKQNSITPAQGDFGPKTMALISSETAPANTTSTASGNTAPATPSLSAPAPANAFTRNLALDDVGTDVKNLQVFLNTHGFLIANYGPGSPGHETTKFGYATQYQLSLFQKKQGISPSTGYFGPSTRALINSLQ